LPSLGKPANTHISSFCAFSKRFNINF
jgi:hypothetical protein